MSQSRVVGAVEIGTSKVAVLLGEIADEEGLTIIGHSASSSRGVKKGVITDLNAASDCVHACIAAAEKKAQTRIDEVYLSQTGRHLQGAFNVGTANVSAADGVIREADIEQAKEDAKRRNLPDGRTYIHHIRNPFFVDQREVANPLAKHGERLQVGYWSVHGDSEAVGDSLRVIKGIDIGVSDIILSGLASGAVLLEDAEKENGALVLDIGGGTTDYVLYRKGYVVRTGVVPVGGDHITNDLSIGLRVGRKSAEAFKVSNGRAYHETGDRNKKEWLIGDLTIGDREYSMAAVTKIIEARVRELFEIVREELVAAELFEVADIASGVFLTGGTSRLEGIDHTAEQVFGLSARVGDPPRDVAEALRAPEYSTALGLLQYALTAAESETAPRRPTGLWRRLTGMLNLD